MPDRPRFDHFVRLGYAVRGAVFLGLAYLAFRTGRGQGATDVVREVRDMPAGPLLLVVVAVGLFALCLWQIVEAWLDLGHRGSDAKGRVRRTGRVAGALGYGALGGAALFVALGSPPAPEAAASITDDVRSVTGGSLALVLVGLAMIAASFGQFSRAWTAKFRNELRGDVPAMVCWAGRAGYAARGVVLVMIGWFTLRAGLHGTHLRDGADVLQALSDHQTIFGLVTGGLGLFGAFSLLESFYRALPREEQLAERAEAKIG